MFGVLKYFHKVDCTKGVIQISHRAEVRKMNKSRLLITAGLTVAVIAGVVSISNKPAEASDYSGQRLGWGRMIEAHAEILGMSTDDLQAELGDKTFYEIAEEKGVSRDQLHEAMQQRAEEHWQEMGFSDDEIAQRREDMAERHESCDGNPGSQMKRGRNW